MAGRRPENPSVLKPLRDLRTHVTGIGRWLGEPKLDHSLESTPAGGRHIDTHTTQPLEHQLARDAGDGVDARWQRVASDHPLDGFGAGGEAAKAAWLIGAEGIRQRNQSRHHLLVLSRTVGGDGAEARDHGESTHHSGTHKDLEKAITGLLLTHGQIPTRIDTVPDGAPAQKASSSAAVTGSARLARITAGPSMRNALPSRPLMTVWQTALGMPG